MSTASCAAEEEVVEYAKWLGMDLDVDSDLFWIAREGLMVNFTPLMLLHRFSLCAF